uniref:Uncharacterized protein n=1 Tax=Panagrolaimus davidi TaxID=227884 RepID=A0A914Q9S4_9BILA
MSKKGLQYCHLIVEAEGLNPLINLFELSNFEIFDSALDVLGEIVQRSYRFRNYCIEQGIIEPLIKLVKNETATEKLKSIGYAVNFILIHTESQVSDDIITRLFPVLNHFLYHDNPSIQMTAAGSYYLLDKNSYGQIFIENNVAKRIIDLLESSDSGLLQSSLLFLQDFAVEMSHPGIQYLIDNGALKNVEKLLKHFDEKVKIETIDFISSFIASSNLTQKQILLNYPELLTSLINFLDHKNLAVRTSTIEMLLKIVYRVNSKQIISMVNENMVYQLCTLLKDNEMMHEILLILKTMMKKSDEKTAMKIIEALQNCDANKIFMELFNYNNEKIVEATTVLTNEIVDAYLWDERRKKDSHEEL